MRNVAMALCFNVLGICIRATETADETTGEKLTEKHD